MPPSDAAFGPEPRSRPSPPLDAEVVVVLEQAVRKEEYSIRLYGALRDFVTRDSAKALLTELIAEERGHLRLVREALLLGRIRKIGTVEAPPALEMPDYLVREEIRSSAGPAALIRLAIRREEEAEEFYLGRAGLLRNHGLAELYLRLAREEAAHRSRLLAGYDDLVIHHRA